MIALATLCLTVAMAFVAFSVDLGYLMFAESELQNATDAGALAGARALPLGRQAAIAAVQRWAGKTSIGGQTVVVTAGEDVEIGVWDDETASFQSLPAGASQSPNAVRVTCRRTTARGNPLKLFFARAIQVTSADLATIATAKLERDTCGLFVGLQNVDVQNAVVDSYDASLGGYHTQTPGDRGGVCSNGPITLSPQGYVNGDARPGEGYSVNMPANVTGNTEPRKRPILWEPVVTYGPSQANNNDRIPAWALTDGGRRVVVEGKKTLVLEPGTYYLPEGLRTAGSGQIVITGPTKLILNGTVTVEGGGIVNQTALPANLRIESVSASARFAGSTSLYADIYAPTTEIVVAGNAGFYGAIFAKRLSMEGTEARMHGDESLRDAFDTYTSRSTLRQ